MPLYRISGMIVMSEVLLPGAWPVESGEPDVTMRRGRVAAALANPLAATRCWEADENHFLLRANGIGRFLISHGREVIFEPEDGVPVSDCAAYLQGRAIGMLLNQRGGIVMHASAVAVDGMALLFCGISGAGKSTLAAALSMRGYGMISDDVCLITFDSDRCPTVRPDARQLKLADTAIEALELNAHRGEPVLGNAEKTYVRPQACWNGADLPLGAIYVLRPGFQGVDLIRSLGRVAALRKLQRHAYRPGMIRRTGMSARYFAASAQIVEHARVYLIERERDLSRLTRTVAMLENHWRRMELGRSNESRSALEQDDFRSSRPEI